MLSKIDYCNAIFPCPSPPKCSSILAYKEVKDLYKIIKRNAASVRSTLGGGNHGLLSLVLSANDYAAVPNTAPFTLPTAPINPTFTRGMDAAKAIRRQHTHERSVAKFHELNDVKTILLQQILHSIGTMYLDAFTNEYTSQLNGDISTIFTYVFNNYAKSAQEDIDEQHDLIISLTYDLRDPLVTVYSPINELMKVAEAADNPFTDTQLVKLALAILQSTSDFEETIIDWNSRTAAICTWDNFKPLFKTRRNALSKARGKTMQGAGLQQANLLAEHMQNTMNHMESTIISRLDALEQQEPEANSDNILPDTANFTTNGTTDILEALKKLTANYNKLENCVAQMNNAGTSGVSRDRTNDHPQGQKSSYQQHPRTIINKHCHNHGGCSHTSSSCKNPKNGHKKNATFQNKMGGSIAFCNDAA